MTQQVVARLTEFSMNLGTLETFSRTARELGSGPRAKIHFTMDVSGTWCLVLELPERAAEALERAVLPPKPTKAQEAVRGQLQDRQEAVRSGAQVSGYVPPVVKRGRMLKKPKGK